VGFHQVSLCIVMAIGSMPQSLMAHHPWHDVLNKWLLRDVTLVAQSTCSTLVWAQKIALFVQRV
jgi:hypothetical protein